MSRRARSSRRRSAASQTRAWGVNREASGGDEVAMARRIARAFAATPGSGSGSGVPRSASSGMKAEATPRASRHSRASARFANTITVNRSSGKRAMNDLNPCQEPPWKIARRPRTGRVNQPNP